MSQEPTLLALRSVLTWLRKGAVPSVVGRRVSYDAFCAARAALVRVITPQNYFSPWEMVDNKVLRKQALELIRCWIESAK